MRVLRAHLQHLVNARLPLTQTQWTKLTLSSICCKWPYSAEASGKILLLGICRIFHFDLTGKYSTKPLAETEFIWTEPISKEPHRLPQGADSSVNWHWATEPFLRCHQFKSSSSEQSPSDSSEPVSETKHHSQSSQLFSIKHWQLCTSSDQISIIFYINYTFNRPSTEQT